MAGGLVGLLDDVAALAKLAAASVDDVGVAAGRASVKAAGVVVDDAAVTPGYVQGLAADRELPIIRRIAVGSLKNKLLFILPVAIVLSELAPKLVEVILMIGGAYLAYEGAHKLLHALRHDDHDHDVPAVLAGPDAEEATIKGAIRTDFILSAEIMVISLKEVIEEPLVFRAVILAVVAVLITVLVYGAVARHREDGRRRPGPRRATSARAQRAGRLMVKAMPVLLRWLSTIGIAAMLWVGGHILLAGADELGGTGPYGVVHDLEDAVHDVDAVGGVLAWLVNTAASALVGLTVGLALTFVVAKLPKRSPAESAAHDRSAKHASRCRSYLIR